MSETFCINNLKLVTVHEMKENLLSLYNQFGSPLLESFVSPKDFLSESMVKKITSKKKTDILNDNVFQIKFEDFKSMNHFIEENSMFYGIESFKEENDFDKKRDWG